jgi:malonyl-CoA/methylmalonyl-CoA synthetase
MAGYDEHTAPDAENLVALIRRRWPADPSTVLLETPGRAPLTYGEAERASARLANALAAGGMGPDDRVAMQVDKSPGAILLYLAIIRAGGVVLPINTAYTDVELDYLLDDAEPSLVVVSPDRADRADRASQRRRVLTLDGQGHGTLAELAAGQPGEWADVARRPEDLAAILYTSGTTGRPKGAMLSHRNLASNAVTLHRLWGFRRDDVLLHVLPIYHTHGLFVATNCVLANGSGMVFLPRFDVDAVVEELPRCTVFMGVPTHYTRLLADPRLDRSRCRHVRLFVSGSAPLLEATHREFLARTGHAILERYGMTETSMIASNPLDRERRAGSVGFSLPGVTVRIADTASGVAVPDGTIGQVEVNGPNVFGGYWHRPELAGSEFTPDGYFRTGDLGRFDADGYLHIASRLKDLIISGGLNVYPKEVEDVIDQIDGVLESAVIGVPDPDLGEAVVAVVVPAPGRTVDESTIRHVARQQLAPFKVPKRVRVVDSLPRNAMSKVEKGYLRDQFGAG